MILLILFNLFLNTDTTKVVKQSCCKMKEIPKLCVGMIPSDTTKIKTKKSCCKTKSTK